MQNPNSAVFIIMLEAGSSAVEAMLIGGGKNHKISPLLLFHQRTNKYIAPKVQRKVDKAVILQPGFMDDTIEVEPRTCLSISDMLLWLCS